jgi:PAS domain S-box-containing protein
MADAVGLGSTVERRAGSSPAPCTADSAAVDRHVRAAADALADGLVVFDAKGVEVYRNHAAAEWLDSTPLELCESGNLAEPFAFRDNRSPGGEHLLATLRAIRNPDASIRGAVCTLHPRHSNHAKEAALRKATQQKRAILDNLPDIAWVKDDAGRFVLVNQRLANAAGRASPDEIVGLTDFDLWPLELAAHYRADDDEVMKTRRHKKLEEPFIASDGTHSWLETIKTCIVDDDDQVIGTTGIARDITERKRIEEDLRATRDMLEKRVLERTAELAEAQENLVRQERLAVLGQLAGGVAHQIRNPLAAIMNATYVLKRHTFREPHPNIEDAIRIIHDEIRHANVIITGLLDYASARNPNRQPTLMGELLERIAASEWIGPTTRVNLELRTAALTIDIDAHQVQEAIANLVRNAVEAMPSGGSLSLLLDVVDNCVVLTISDTGSGILPSIRARLFEPLHSTKPLGVGLGLVTARRILEAHGGSITCLEVAHGAAFEVRLPIS